MIIAPYAFATGSENQNSVIDSLFAKYLSNISDAAEKIKELTAIADTAKKYPEKKSSAIRIYQAAMSLAPYAIDSFEVLSLLHSQFAGLMHEYNAEELFIEYEKKALAYHRKAYPEATSRGYNLIGGIGSHYLRIQQYDSALYYFKLQLTEARNTKVPLWIAGAYNNTGILFLNQRHFEVARLYFDSAVAVLKVEAPSDSTLFGSITDNLAQLAFKQSNYAEAAELFKKNISWYSSVSDSQNIVKSYEGLAKVLLKEKKLNEAANIISHLKHFPGIEKGKYSMKYALGYFDLQSDYFLAKGNWQAALETQLHLAAFKDSVNAVLLSNQGELMQAVTASELYRFNTDLKLYGMQLAAREKDLKDTRRSLFAALVFALLSVIIAVLLFYFFRNRSRIQQHEIELHKIEKQLAETTLKNHQLEKEKLQSELKNKSKDLSDFSFYLKNLKELNNTLAEKLGGLEKLNPKQQKELLGNMLKELNMQHYTQEKVQLVQENIDNVNHELYSILLKRFPDLSKSELELCGFLRLNMSNKDISILKKIEPESVKMARYRLRKKLLLDSETDIYRFLSEI